MPAKTANFGITKPLDSDAPPSLEHSVGPGFDDVDDLLGAIDLSQLAAGGPNNGKLVVVNSGAAAYKAMKGDATFAEDGTLTIGEKKVGTSKLADKAATTAKIDDGAVTETQLGDGAVTSRKAKLTSGLVVASAETGGMSETEWTDIVGASTKITPVVPSILLVTAVFEFFGHGPSGNKDFEGGLKVDGVAQNGVAAVRFEKPITENGLSGGKLTVAQTWRVALTAAEHTIKLVGKDVTGTSLRVLPEGTRFTYLLHAS